MPKNILLPKRTSLLKIMLRWTPLAALCVVFPSCAEPARVNAPPASPPASRESSATNGVAPPQPEVTRAAPPTLAEARDVLERVYRRAVVVDEKSQGPPLAGDFNGDGSQDVAVPVVPARGRLEEINSEIANWIVQDPQRVAASGRQVVAHSGPWPPKIEPRDAPLAIIHGHGPLGWRDPSATQSYLLKTVAGEGLRVVPLREFPPAFRVRRNSAGSRADIITGKLSGAAGFLYWAGGRYVWQEH